MTIFDAVEITKLAMEFPEKTKIDHLSTVQLTGMANCVQEIIDIMNDATPKELCLFQAAIDRLTNGRP